MKRILLPTDFSENAWNAIEFTCRLLSEDKCELYLLNTYTPVIYHLEYVLVNPAQFGMGDPIRENSERCLENLRQRIKDTFDNPKHKIECISAFNTLIPEIREVVEQKDIDLIVMGTKGATGAKEVLFGSNTVHVFKAVDRPVMAVPDNYSYEQPKEILLPTDYRVNLKRDHIRLLMHWASYFNARMHVMHVYDENEFTQIQQKNKDQLHNLLAEVPHMFHDLEEQSIPEAITNFQLKWKVNLLVMINNKHSFFENLFFRPTINQIGFHLNVPFLVIPSGK
ncbi:MAG: universal stress protein [Flavobacteriaceae bacterium]|nr:universal stress protein [Bacteroidia bacterium]NNK87978.1 universal stress protein [Flavobacteriaceae bacterium]